MSSDRHPSSILQQLEMQSQKLYPGFQPRARQATRPEHHQQQPSQDKRRGLCWQDAVWLTLAGLFAVLFLLRLGTAHAQTSIPTAAETWSQTPLASSPGTQGAAQSLAPAEPWGLSLQADQHSTLYVALDTAIHVEVTGLLARVHVAQSFRNDSIDWVEGTYRFPLPDGAAVDRLFVDVGGRILEGEIQERETAQQIYQQAKVDGKTASLVRQERANQFQTSLANIGPGEQVSVMISFLTNVDYRDGEFRLRLPNTFTSRYGSEAQPGTNGFTNGLPAPRPQLTSMSPSSSHGFSLQVDLAAGFPISGVESLYHDVDIQAVDNGYQVTLFNPDEKTDRAFELRWQPEFGAQPNASLATWSNGQDVFAQLMLIPPADGALQPQPREVIFVIDTSGSMEGESIAQARAALLAGLDALAAGDRFNLIQFNSITEPLFREALAATASNLSTAHRWINKLHADGGTEMAPALRAALRQQGAKNAVHTGAVDPALIRQVVFITDGSVGNERELLGEIANMLGDSRLFTVAIGSAPNSWFMRKAAEIGRGHHTHIGRQADVGQTMTALWKHLRLPAVSNLCIDWGVEAEYYPEILPDLYAGQPLWVVARMDQEPGPVSLCGELNGYNWQHQTWPETVAGQDTLATLWARRKIESLQDSLMFGADADLMRLQITELALDHQLLTAYTSMVAVDQTPSRPAGEALARADVPSLLPAGSANSAAFPATATGWKTQLLLSLLVLGLSGGLFLKPYFRLPVFTWRGVFAALRP